jgi:hypothetical protein
MLTGLPGGNVLVEAVQAVQDRRQRQAREILLEELRQGEAFIERVEEIDEIAAMLLKYVRMAEEGTARLNLRMMAMIIRGMSIKRTLVASKFLYYASFIAALGREEVIAITTLYKNERINSPRSRARLDTKAELVPSIFPTEEHLNGALQAASRTGLVIPRSGWGSLVYETTPLMEEVASLAPLQDALREP